MRIDEFENAVWETEGVRIVIRAPVNQQVEDYDQQRRAIQTWSIQEFLNQRIVDRIGNRQVEVVNGAGRIPRRHTRMRTIRRSYG